MKKAGRKLLGRWPWGSFCRRDQHKKNISITDCSAPVPPLPPVSSMFTQNHKEKNLVVEEETDDVSSQIAVAEPEEEEEEDIGRRSFADKNLCAICLDPLGVNAGQRIFTAQCSHTFHFTCISSNVRHGSVKCPICRAHWTQLPHNPTPGCPLHNNTDPSYANLGAHRNAFLHPRYSGYNDYNFIDLSRDALFLHPRYSGNNDYILLNQSTNALYLHPRDSDNNDHILLDQSRNAFLHPRYSDNNDHVLHDRSRNAFLHPRYSDNNDHIVLDQSANEPRLHLMLHTEISPNCFAGGPSSMEQSSNRAYLWVKLLNPPAIDLVVVVSPSGPRLRLMKQAMALTVFSLRPVDRLAIVTYSSGSVRPFPLRSMTACGKRTALHVIDRIFYMGQHADPIEGLTRGSKILENRLHGNPRSSIIHLTDIPVMVPFPVHTFHVRHEFSASNRLFVDEFEEFLASVIGGGVEDVDVTIGEGGMVVSIGEMMGGEERNVPVRLADTGRVRLGYRYKEGDCSRMGEVVVEVKREPN